MTKKFSLDIFGLLQDLNNPKSDDIYAKLSDAEKKGFAPLVVMRWMTGTSDEQQIMLVNEFVNPAVFPLAAHPHLLMLLLQVSNTKTNKRYQWLSNTGSKSKNTEAVRAVCEYFEMSKREAERLNPFPPAEEIIQMAEELGWQKDEMSKLKKEIAKGE
jgi:hypothetical protein